jgi:hypothetical protein
MCFSIFDTIRFGEDFETKKSRTMTVKSENFTESDHMILPFVSDNLVYPPLKIDQFHDCNNFFQHCGKVFHRIKS